MKDDYCYYHCYYHYHFLVHFFGLSLMEKAKPSHNSSVSHRRRQKCKFCTFRDRCIFDEKNLCEFIQKHVLQTEKASWFAINGQTVNHVSYWVCHLRLLLEMNGFFLYPCHLTGLSFQLVDVLLYHGAYTTLREAIYLKSGKHVTLNFSFISCGLGSS